MLQAGMKSCARRRGGGGGRCWRSAYLVGYKAPVYSLRCSNLTRCGLVGEGGASRGCGEQLVGDKFLRGNGLDGCRCSTCNHRD